MLSRSGLGAGLRDMEWETGETGEAFDLFRRRMPDFRGIELKFINRPRSRPERRR